MSFEKLCPFKKGPKCLRTILRGTKLLEYADNKRRGDRQRYL